MDQLGQYIEFNMQQSQLDTTMNSEGQKVSKKIIKSEIILQLIQKKNQQKIRQKKDMNQRLNMIKDLVDISDKNVLRNSLARTIYSMKVELREQRQQKLGIYNASDKNYKYSHREEDKQIKDKTKQEIKDIKQKQEKIQRLISLLNELFNHLDMKKIQSEVSTDKLKQRMEQYGKKINEIKSQFIPIKDRLVNIYQLCKKREISSQMKSNVIGIIYVLYKKGLVKNLGENWQKDIFECYCHKITKQELKLQNAEVINQILKSQNFTSLSPYIDNNFELRDTQISFEDLARQIILYVNESLQKKQEISWEIIRQNVSELKNKFFRSKLIAGSKQFGWWLLAMAIDDKYGSCSMGKIKLHKLLNLDEKGVSKIQKQINNQFYDFYDCFDQFK